MVVNIVIYGSGALGSLFGALLSQQHEILLIGRKNHLHAIQEKGLILAGTTKGLFWPSTIQKNIEYDVVILTTKAYDTESAIKDIVIRFGNIPVISLQNGLSNEEKIASIIGLDNTIGGVTSHGATLLEDGKIYHAGSGSTIIGSFNGVTSLVKNIANAFNTCGISTTVSKDIKKDIWKKSIVNASINALTAILGCKNGFLLENKFTLNLIEKICMECIEIAESENILIYEDIILETKSVAKCTSANVSSMLQDLLNNKKTEVHQIHGAFTTYAKQHNIEAPLNNFILQLINILENVRHLGWPDDHELSRRGP